MVTDPYSALTARNGRAFADDLARDVGKTPAEVNAALQRRVTSGELTRHDTSTGTYYTRAGQWGGSTPRR
jgi:predicted transcriptional regulator